MTAIVGLVTKRKSWMGGDSASSRYGFIQCDALPKVFRRGEFVMGCAGDARLSDLMRYAFKPPTLPARCDVTAFMAIKFSLAVKACFKRMDYSTATEGEQAYSGSILVGVRGSLYTVDGNFALLKSIDGFDAIGVGASVALGALYATPDLHPVGRLTLALEAAAKYCDGVCPPFIVESL